MIEKRQHVIKAAHQLFIEKGFAATSIQDILDHSGISKGTFYNYFASKTELLIALFKSLSKQIELARNELLIEGDKSDIDLFVKQIELQLQMNRANKLFTLFEEVIVSNDPDLNQFMKKASLMSLRWVYLRFLDIFGESNKRFLLDCSISFLGILKSNIRYHSEDSTASFQQLVRYSVNRIARMVEELSQTNEVLFEPERLDSWLPRCKSKNQKYRKDLKEVVASLKASLPGSQETDKYKELLEFIKEEILGTNSPRKFLIETTLHTITGKKEDFRGKDLEKLVVLVESFLAQGTQKEDLSY
ncbi:TetR/AcrR family transcriptional regulator [Peribacillus sp. SCS-37]|uniref:TetR/AcrR family transcriptional regulator n=1 Tax=Paraperibacillus esterisolvens TaxID=3115296 RepID=UPI003906938E